ncbi:hypothetical protein ACQSSU_03215 [Micromonospora echinospora]
MTRAAAAVMTAVLAVAAAGCGNDDQADPDPAGTQSADGQGCPDWPVCPTTPASSPTGPAVAAPAELRDWIYVVGLDVPAGTYVTTVPARHPHPCYWARLRSFGKPDSVVDEGNPTPGEAARVTVLPGDRGFKVSNGCTWTAAAPL